MYLWKTYGKHFQIHIIEHCGINASILADINKCYHRITGSGDGTNSYLPANCMKYVFHYHYSRNTLIGYMTNSAVELTGKLSNHVSQTFCSSISINSLLLIGHLHLYLPFLF